MLLDARAKVSNATFMKADIFKVELPKHFYDETTIFFSLAADSSRDMIKRQIKRMYDWLKIDGVLVLATVPFARNQVHSYFMGRPFVTSGLSQKEYLHSIKQVGFKIVHHNLSSFKPKAVEAGICEAEENVEEPHLYVYAKK